MEPPRGLSFGWTGVIAAAEDLLRGTDFSAEALKGENAFFRRGEAGDLASAAAAGSRGERTGEERGDSTTSPTLAAVLALVTSSPLRPFPSARASGS